MASVNLSRGLIKDGNKNRLRAQDIHRIVDTFNRQVEVPRYSRMVPLSEISDSKNDFNLNLPRYIDNSEPEDLQDIDGHLRGGIPERDIDALERYWKVFPSMRSMLFESAGRPGYLRLKVAANDIKSIIFDHEEFKTFKRAVTALFAKWKGESLNRLMAVSKGERPKALIDALSEDLLATFSKVKLIDPYDVYQHLMDYWAATMQDDVYLIAHTSWAEAAKPRMIVESREQKNKEEPDFTVGKQKFKSDLVPASLLVSRYFSTDRAAIEAIQAELSSLEQKLEELREEHGVEGGLLEEVVNENGKMSKKAVDTRLKEVERDPEAQEEKVLLAEYAALLDREADAKGRLKAAEARLTESVAGRYGKLPIDDIKSLVVEDKWLAALAADVQTELDRVSQSLTGRIRQLAERYAAPLPQITVDVAALSAKVDAHLKRMGAAWD